MNLFHVTKKQQGGGLKLETFTGNPATFTPSYSEELPAPFNTINCKCSINAIQEGTPWIDSNVIEKEPYNFRKVAGTATRIGNHLFDKLVGGTVAWNQLADYNWGSPNTNTTKTYNSTTHETTITPTNGQATNSLGLWATGFDSTHRYLFNVEVYPSASGTFSFSTIYFNLTGSTWHKVTKIISVSTITMYAQGEASGWTGSDNFIYRNTMIIDLTAMFGSTIADYIYSLEQATAGAGVAWFRKLFPNDYYAYNAGELISVKTTAHKMVGKNLFDKNQSDTTVGFIDDNGNITYSDTWKTSDYLPIAAGDYTFSGVDIALGGYYGICWYDANQTLIGGFSSFTVVPVTVTIPSGASFIRYSWSIHSADTFMMELGSQATAYEPYTEHNYPLDDVELRGLFKLDSNNKLYADGDTYESSGDVTRKYGIVDLGSLSWRYDSQHTRFVADILTLKPAPASSDYKTGILAGKFFIPNGSPITYQDIDNTIARYTSGHSIYVVCMAYTDATDFKNYVSGVYLVYELETTTTETADTFTNPQQVDANGTEEYIDSRTPAIPVGHETYYADIYDITGFTACKVSVKDGSNVERKSATIQFGQTVYGGYLEFKNGAWEFTGTKQIVTYTGSENWQYNAGYVFIEIDNNFMSFDKINCNIYKGTIPKWYSDVGEGEVAISLGSNGELTPWINIHNSSYKNVDEFKSDISNKNMQIIYKLATPFTITLTGTQLETLLGENRVSHNCNGDIEVTCIV